ncbi:MAG TPA: CGNR zinc finger domain-containing protein [Acidobacteriaceae bacterium]
MRKAPFKLTADHVALDFVNTLDDRFKPGGSSELLPTFPDLLRFCRQADILTHGEAARLSTLPEAAQEKGLRTAIELRELLARVFYRCAEGASPSVDDRLELQRWAAACARHRELRWADGQLVWAWKALAGNADAPALLLAQHALDLLLGKDPPRLHTCASDTCRWLFLDTSKNHTRRWCDMKTCGNRAKARRYSAAHQN